MKRFQELFEELRAVRYACPEIDLTVILETAVLEPMQIIIGCMLCREAGVDDVMTSTGFSTSGASAENVSLMRSVLGDDLGVIASDITISSETILEMLKAGATGLSLSFSSSNEALSGLLSEPDQSVDE